MNDKEKLAYDVLSICAGSCGYSLSGGGLSITPNDIVSRNRSENVTMSRCIAVGMLVSLGFTITTCARILNRSAPAIRNMINMDRQLQETSRVYRMAYREARNQIRSKTKEEDDEKKDD